MAYLEYNATTPLAPCALAAMLPVLERDYGNPSGIHGFGRRARAVLDDSWNTMAGRVAAAEWVTDGLDTEQLRLQLLTERLWDGVERIFPAATRNGQPDLTLSNTLNVSFPGADGEMLLIGLDLEEIAVSSGSACMVGSVQPSHDLITTGVEPAPEKSTEQFSSEKPTSREEIDAAIEGLSPVIDRQFPQLQPEAAV